MASSMENPMDRGWGRFEVGEFSKSPDLSVSKLYPGTKARARPRVFFGRAFAGDRVLGQRCFDFNRPSSCSTKQVKVAAGQLKRSPSSKHTSEEIRCGRGPLTTAGVASMATANTIAVARNVRRVVAELIFCWESSLYYILLNNCGFSELRSGREQGNERAEKIEKIGGKRD